MQFSQILLQGVLLEIITKEAAVRFLEMTDDRNMTSHTYKEEVSKLLYEKMRNYYILMKKLMGKNYSLVDMMRHGVVSS